MQNSITTLKLIFTWVLLLPLAFSYGFYNHARAQSSFLKGWQKKERKKENNNLVLLQRR